MLHQHGAGGLRYETDFPDPEPGEGDVVVRVRATSLNYHDVFTRRGMPGIRIAMPAIMGLDVAGEIAAIGPGVSGWKIGCGAEIGSPAIGADAPRFALLRKLARAAHVVAPQANATTVAELSGIKIAHTTGDKRPLAAMLMPPIL